MADLTYLTLLSLDGYIAGEDGTFEWAAPDEEVHQFINDLARPVGTYLYGRRMYEVMKVWETDPSVAAQSAATGDFAEVWQAADKVVYSTTLEAVTTARTRIERAFDPEAVRHLKSDSASGLSVGGPDLAGQAMRHGLLDELHLFLAPVLVGGGTRAFPADVRLDLDLQEQRRFGNGMVYLRYLVRG